MENGGAITMMTAMIWYSDTFCVGMGVQLTIMGLYKKKPYCVSVLNISI